jgi:hypothetical protein
MRTPRNAEENGTVAWTDYVFALVLLPLSIGWLIVTLGFSWIWGEGALLLYLLVLSVSFSRYRRASLPDLALVATLFSCPAFLFIWIAGPAFSERIDPRFFSLGGTIIEIVVLPLVFLPLFRLLSQEYMRHLETSVDWLRSHAYSAELGCGWAIFHLLLLIPFIVLLLVYIPIWLAYIGIWLLSLMQVTVSVVLGPVHGYEWWFIRMVFGAWTSVSLAFGCAAVWYFHHNET